MVLQPLRAGRIVPKRLTLSSYIVGRAGSLLDAGLDPEGERHMDYSNRTYLQSLFVDTLPDCALVLLDLDGKILTWNAGAEALHGYPEAEIIGRHFSCLFAPGDIDATKPGTSLAAAQALGRHDEICQRLHRDGSQRKVQDILIPLYDSNRTLVAFGNLTRALAPPANIATANIATARIAPVDVASGQAVPTKGLRLVPAGQRRKVLLVDDDEDARPEAADMLTGLGYEVAVASSGAEALDLLARVADIDVLFTDVIMPGGMDGGELAERARQLLPGIRTLFTSGYFEGALVNKGSIAANTHFLVKPYRRKDLARMMNQVLEVDELEVSEP